MGKFQQKEPPEGWQNRELFRHLDAGRDNQYACFANSETRQLVLRALDIDDALHTVLDGWHGTAEKDFPKQSHYFAASMLYRCHAAYRASAMLAFSGMVPEAYPTLRAVIEWSGYACRLIESDKATRAWLERDNSPESRRKCANQFGTRKLENSVRRHDETLADAFRNMYEMVIDYGAHPNMYGALSGAKVGGDSNTFQFTAAYLQGPSVELSLVLKTVCRAGYFPLGVMQFLFPERLNKTGVTDRLSKLSSGL